MNRPEEALQRSICAFLDVSLPPGSLYFFINNAHASPRMRMVLKGLGQKPGIPDLCILYRGKSIFIELKAKYRKPTKIQLEMHECLILAGAIVHVVKSLEELEGFLAPLIPLKGRIAA